MNDTLSSFYGTVLLYIKKLYMRTFRKQHITHHYTQLHYTIQHYTTLYNTTTLLRFYFMWMGVHVEVEGIYHTYRIFNRQKIRKFLFLIPLPVLIPKIS